MYCANCGVELQKGIEKCPLCGLRAWHPELREAKEALPYPQYLQNEEKRSLGWVLVITAILMIPMVLCLAIDLRISGAVCWSGYVVGGVLTGYISFVLPLWFRRCNPVVFLPVGMAAVMLLLLYISVHTGGQWFLSFAFPVAGCVLILAETVTVLLRYAVKKKKHRAAVILGGGVIALGALCILVEFLIHITFHAAMLWWSFIPFAVLLVLGLIMIFIGSNAALRNSLYKRFFI